MHTHPWIRVASVPIAILAIVAIVAGSALGQGSYLYSPPETASSDGAQVVQRIGYRPAMRQQLLDGELRGQSVTLNEVALRVDWSAGSPWFVRGRTWSNVTIDIADGDITQFTRDFSKNLVATPTRVFSGSVSWPTLENLKPVRPRPWGGSGSATGAYAYPFQTGWVSTGQRDIVTDWNFRGGTLHQQKTWDPNLYYFYYFDGYGGPLDAGVGLARRIPELLLNNDSKGVTTRCNDSFMGSYTPGAFVLGSAFAYASSQQLRVSSWGLRCAPNAPVIHGWGLQSDDTGIDVGTGCNRLHIRGPMELFAVRSDATSAHRFDLVVPWHPSYGHQQVTMQAAWTDSVTRRLALTQAIEVTLPGHIPPSRHVARRSILESDVLGVTGPFAFGTDNPVLRYRY